MSDTSALIAPATEALTIESNWFAASSRGIDDELLQWPPDIFAFAHVALDRAEAYRFVVSPPAGHEWPPTPSWSEDVASAATSWRQWTQHPLGDPPDLVMREWEVVRSAATTSLDDLASGREWRICTALLTLHAISDQAAVHEPSNVDRDEDGEPAFNARSRDMLRRTGSMSRIHPGLLRVLPKYRTPPGGITSRSIARYGFVTGPAVDVRVNQFAEADAEPRSGECNVLLLPWPLQVTAADFRPVDGSIHERDIEPYGYFKFSPAEHVDASLADRVLTAARERAERIDLVVLPESSVSEADLDALEAVLARHGVSMVIAGVREEGHESGEFPANWIHFGALADGRWTHYRQDKHHRWSLDPRQIAQYHLDEVLDPRVRWWEALQLRRRSLHLMECPSGLTLAALVCEDLAHMDDVAELLRNLGPALLMPLVLDGPQLASRWTARYASIFADDPGSAVLTLSSHGMVRRSWKEGQPPSSVVALWRDPATGVHELELAAGAQALLVTADRMTAIRRAADGRSPELDVADLKLAKVTQIRAAEKL